MRSHFVALVDVYRTAQCLVGHSPALLANASVTEFAFRLDAGSVAANFALRHVQAVNDLSVAVLSFP